MTESTRVTGWHTHNWYPVAVQGQPPTDEWVCIVQGCGYRMMPPAVLAAHDARVRAEALREHHSVIYIAGNELVCYCGVHLSNYGITRSLTSVFAEHVRRVRAALPAPDPESGQ